jgi:hypothetical protein
MKQQSIKGLALGETYFLPQQRTDTRSKSYVPQSEDFVPRVFSLGEPKPENAPDGLRFDHIPSLAHEGTSNPTGGFEIPRPAGVLRQPIIRQGIRRVSPGVVLCIRREKCVDY